MSGFDKKCMWNSVFVIYFGIQVNPSDGPVMDWYTKVYSHFMHIILWIVLQERGCYWN